MRESGRGWAFLSNGMTSAIESEGSIEWFPCPRFDSPSIFSRILDEGKGGSFSVMPESKYTVKTEYVKDTLALRNTFATGAGKLKVTDAIPIGICGIVRAYESEIPFIAEIDPRFGYGRRASRMERKGDELLFRDGSSREGIRLRIEGRFKVTGEGRVRLGPGKGSIFLLYSRNLGHASLHKNIPQASENMAMTEEYWREQMGLVRKADRYGEFYRRSLLTVLGMIYRHSGGIMAAPSTSLPEAVGASRNWDYRYVWIRDASYAAEALASAGCLVKARNAISFMAALISNSSKPFRHPLYSVEGTAPQREKVLGWLSGHLGSRPVRVGNHAYEQVQMDVEGAFMEALYRYVRLSRDMVYARENWQRIASVAEWAKDSWRKKSTDIWEQRSEPRHFVHTKVMQWVALDRSRRLAEMLGHDGEAKRWERSAERMRKEILEKGFSKEARSFVQHYGSKEVDAALLTMPLYGFIDAKDPRFRSTLRRIEKELVVDRGLVMRYRSDFWGRAQNPFTLCSTWLARVYLRNGERRKAEAVIEKLIHSSNKLMLLGEHIEIKTLEPRGNFPQLFPHAGMVEAIAELSDPRLFSV